jgi:hypothetical protein
VRREVEVILRTNEGIDVRTPGSEVTSWWGSTVAGVFVILAVLVVLGELGAAIGLTAFEPGDRVGAYALGAGVWGFVAGIVSFLLGGFVSTSCARPRRTQLGLWNGAMVWCVAVPTLGVLAAILAIGATTAGAVATTAAAVTDVAEGRTAPPGERARTDVPTPTPAAVEKATRTAGGVGWAMVAALLLTLAAAAVGGVVGARFGAAAVRTVPEGMDPPRREGLSARAETDVRP